MFRHRIVRGDTALGARTGGKINFHTITPLTRDTAEGERDGLDRAGTVRAVPQDPLPPDPFAGDPDDPSMTLGDEDSEHGPPLGEEERAELVSDLTDLAVYQALLEPRDVRGIVVDCADCAEAHYHDWELLRSSLEQLLHDGRMRPHEPAYDPDPGHYVSWEYCRGFADGVTETENENSR